MNICLTRSVKAKKARRDVSYLLSATLGIKDANASSADLCVRHKNVWQQSTLLLIDWDGDRTLRQRAVQCKIQYHTPWAFFSDWNRRCMSAGQKNVERRSHDECSDEACDAYRSRAFFKTSSTKRLNHSSDWSRWKARLPLIWWIAVFFPRKCVFASSIFPEWSLIE